MGFLKFCLSEGLVFMTQLVGCTLTEGMEPEAWQPRVGEAGQEDAFVGPSCALASTGQGDQRPASESSSITYLPAW